MQKFLFDTSFDPEDIQRARATEARRKKEAERAAQEAAERAAQEPPEPEPERFTEDDLAAAKAAGFAEGEAAGRAAMERSAERQLAQVLEQVPGQLPDLIGAQKQSDADLAEHAVGIVMTLAHKLLPELARRRGLAEIEAVVRDCLVDMLDEPRLVIRVSDEMLDMVRARLDPMVADTGFEGAIVCMADAAMGPSDCRVDWADGGAERLSARLWDDIEQTVARYFDYPGAAADVIDAEAQADAEHPADAAMPFAPPSFPAAHPPAETR